MPSLVYKPGMDIKSGPRFATLTGLAVGDALGKAFETKPAKDPALLAWRGWFEPSEYHKLGANQWTDDTMMAKLLGESLFETRTYCPGDVSKRYEAWYNSGDFRGMGKSTKTALARLAKGSAWTQSGVANAQGNGTAMRAAPIGLMFRNNAQAAMDMARIDAQITHKSLEAEEGSMAIALAVAMLAQGSASKDTVMPKVLNWIDGKSQTTARIRQAMAFSHRPLPRQDLQLTGLVKAISEMGTSAHVIQTVPAAFLCFSLTDNFKDAVESAVRAGGDTDTTAAIVGALAGTWYGIEQVAPYLADLEEAQTLRDLEQNLYGAARPVY